MSADLLTLDEYQKLTALTDRTRRAGMSFDLAILGLVGETGSLLSEAKKKQRDALSYVGYEETVVEETGDVLWYLATIATHGEVTLSSVVLKFRNAPQCTERTSPSDIRFSDLQASTHAATRLASPTFERTLLQLAAAVGQVAAVSDVKREQGNAALLIERLAAVFDLLIRAATDAGISLATAAYQNLTKIADRWPVTKVFPSLFDETFPAEEQLFRELTIDIFERKAHNGKHYVVQRCNGLFIGDRLTDNIMKPDDYRFHDAFHYAYAAVLGWSPVIRALFRLKRKSETNVDEGQDGARAILIEEGVATYVFGHAKQVDSFAGLKPGDLSFTLLKAVRHFVRGYESDACPLWLWEDAILQGYAAFRFLREHRSARLQLDLHSRTLRVAELPS